MPRFRMTVTMAMEIDVEAPTFEAAMVESVVPFVSQMKAEPMPATTPKHSFGPIKAVRILVPGVVEVRTRALPDEEEKAPHLKVVPPPPPDTSGLN